MDWTAKVMPSGYFAHSALLTVPYTNTQLTDRQAYGKAISATTTKGTRLKSEKLFLAP